MAQRLFQKVSIYLDDFLYIEDLKKHGREALKPVIKLELSLGLKIALLGTIK